MVKDLGVGARLPRTYALRSLYGIVLAAALWASFRGASSLLRISEAAALARGLFLTFVLVQFAGVTLYSLMAGADHVAKEIRSDTLGLLALTPLTGRTIVVGKWLATIAQSAYLMLCGLPVLAACVYLGGVGLKEFLASFFATLASSILAAALSVWAASLGRNPYGAGALAGLAYLVYHAAWTVFQMIAPELGGYVHPIGVLLRGFSYSSPSIDPPLGFLTIVPVCAGISWLILTRAGSLIVSPRTLAPRNVRTYQEIEERRAYLETAAQNLGTRVREIAVWDRHPLVWKDIRTRAAAHLSYELRLGLGFLLGILFLCSLVAGRGEQAAFFHGLFPLAILLAVCAGSAHYFRDRDAGRGDTLSMLPVSTWEIVRSKLISGPASPEGFPFLVLLLLSLHPYFFQGSWSDLCQAGVAVFVFILFAYTLASIASLLLHKTRLAILASGSVVAGILAGLPPDEHLLHPYRYLSGLRSFLDLGVYAAAYLLATLMLIGLLILLLRRRLNS